MPDVNSFLRDTLNNMKYDYPPRNDPIRVETHENRFKNLFKSLTTKISLEKDEFRLFLFHPLKPICNFEITFFRAFNKAFHHRSNIR